MPKQPTLKPYICLAVLVVAAICAISYTDLVIRPEYWQKTMVKAPIFFCVPLLFAWRYPVFRPFQLLKPNTRGLKLGLALGLGIYGAVLGFYLLANQMADLSGIRTSLEENLGIGLDNFLLVGLYVAVCNSFLEEWFFRGFVFGVLRGKSRALAYGVSSLSFGVYHLAMMDGMFSPWIVALVLVGLFAGGTIFNYLNEKNHNIYASWFCHSFANFAMTTVGALIFL